MCPSRPLVPRLPASSAAALHRRDFLRLTALSGLWIASGALPATGEPADDVAAGTIPDEFPRQSPDAVRDVVGAAHTDLERVRALVAARPALARASWDWGFGDWETPLGAASHMGRRDIAEVLLAHGARPNVFSAAMLGQLEVVRAFVTAAADLAAIEGPHGIPLIAHARAGGDAARDVVAYLESVLPPGGFETPPETTEAERAGLLGVYVFGAAPDEVLEVSERRGALRIGRSGGGARNLTRVEALTFRPAGAPEVRVKFRMEGARAAALTVHDGPLVVQARRREG